MSMSVLETGTKPVERNQTDHTFDPASVDDGQPVSNLKKGIFFGIISPSSCLFMPFSVRLFDPSLASFGTPVIGLIYSLYPPIYLLLSSSLPPSKNVLEKVP
jgi:hypothetical protein